MKSFLALKQAACFFQTSQLEQKSGRNEKETIGKPVDEELEEETSPGTLKNFVMFFYSESTKKKSKITYSVKLLIRCTPTIDL